VSYGHIILQFMQFSGFFQPFIFFFYPFFLPPYNTDAGRAVGVNSLTREEPNLGPCTAPPALVRTRTAEPVDVRYVEVPRAAFGVCCSGNAGCRMCCSVSPPSPQQLSESAPSVSSTGTAMRRRTFARCPLTTGRLTTCWGAGTLQKLPYVSPLCAYSQHAQAPSKKPLPGCVRTSPRVI